jgi:hypothetical protein
MYDSEHYNKVALTVRTNQLLKYYGITPEQYQELYRLQKGRCAICLIEKGMWKGERGGKHTDILMVDHDHLTKRVRGLLCHRCNFGLGQFQDNADLVLGAYRYLSLLQT